MVRNFYFFRRLWHLSLWERQSTEGNCTESDPFRCPPLPPLVVTGAMTIKMPLPMMGWLYGQAIDIFIFSETTGFRSRISATAFSSTH